MVLNVEEFCYSVNKKGKGFRNQAMELIKICRELSVVAEQSPNQDHLLQGVLGACDTAINKSARRRNNVVGPIKQAIKDAIRELIEYGREYHPSNGTIEPRMEVAKNEDKNSSTRRIVC